MRFNLKILDIGQHNLRNKIKINAITRAELMRAAHDAVGFCYSVTAGNNGVGKLGVQPTTHAYSQITKANRHNATMIAALPQFHLTDCHHSMGNIASSFDCASDK